MSFYNPMDVVMKDASPEFTACVHAGVPMEMTTDPDNKNIVHFKTAVLVGFVRDENDKIVTVVTREKDK